MHIDHDNLDLKSEGDVEAKLLVPLITSALYLDIPSRSFYSKEYLSATDLDKGAKKTGGYFPDYSVWMHGFPVMIVEAKTPGIPIAVAYREAALYASHLNRKYPADFNPCRYLIASNGQFIWFGHADANQEYQIEPKDIAPGGNIFTEIQAKYGVLSLRKHAIECLEKVKLERATRPYMLAGGQAVINARKPLNSFARDLSPVLTRYFSSQNVTEIARRAYVSSAEVTEYDRVLESLLKDRASVRKDTIVESLTPTRRDEPRITKAIETYRDERPEGQLQIIQGAVGAGKSLFIRRYRDTLQSDELKKACCWAWVDFNPGPGEVNTAQKWLCESFLESFTLENPEVDQSSPTVLRGIFSKQIMKRKGIYEDIGKDYPQEAAKMRAEDLRQWQDDPFEFAKGIAEYVRGSINQNLIVVMDNVDRLHLNDQLSAFHLSLWFMQQTKCFVVLQKRDETYERFKGKPPLDTFRSGVAFHISPPRFIDVVKRRLALSIEYLAARSQEAKEYSLPSGARIIIPGSALGEFLHELYVELFERRGNISRVLESLAGSNVRRALEMFVKIITSGHLREDQITSQVRGAKGVAITEQNVLKILMRTENQFFFDNDSGFMSNIFYLENLWNKPTNFLVAEVLFFLSINRKERGQIQIEGYFTVRHIADVLQKRGYDPDDTFAAVNHALKKFLISADHMDNTTVELDDSVKIAASGYIHLRILSDRLEYLYGVIATTPIADNDVARFLAQFVDRENKLGILSNEAKVQAVEALYRYLFDQAVSMSKDAGIKFDLSGKTSGSAYVLRQMKSCIDRFRMKEKQAQDSNILDA